MDKILDSADKPLDGEGWWMKSEEPWQTLACCMEIANAVRSPNHEGVYCVHSKRRISTPKTRDVIITIHNVAGFAIYSVL